MSEISRFKPTSEVDAAAAGKQHPQLMLDPRPQRRMRILHLLPRRAQARRQPVPLARSRRGRPNVCYCRWRLCGRPRAQHEQTQSAMNSHHDSDGALVAHAKNTRASSAMEMTAGARAGGVSPRYRGEEDDISANIRGLRLESKFHRETWHAVVDGGGTLLV